MDSRRFLAFTASIPEIQTRALRPAVWLDAVIPRESFVLAVRLTSVAMMGFVVQTIMFFLLFNSRQTRRTFGRSLGERVRPSIGKNRLRESAYGEFFAQQEGMIIGKEILACPSWSVNGRDMSRWR